MYNALAQSLKAPITEKRIWKLQWRDNEIDMECEVGKPLPSSYQTGKELDLAIFECENLYNICTLSRGGVKGEPILAGKNSQSSATYFSDNVNNWLYILICDRLFDRSRCDHLSSIVDKTNPPEFSRYD